MRPPSVRTTEASQQIAETPLERIAENNRPPIPGTDSVRNRVKGDYDRFDLTMGGRVKPEDKYNNVGPDRVVAFVRRDEYWGRFGATDRVEQVDNSIDDMQVVTRKRDGKPVIEDDTIAVSIPLETYKAYQAAEQTRIDEWERQVGTKSEEDIWETDLEGQYKGDVDTMRRNAEVSRMMAHRNKLTGEQSPTHGMTYQQAMHLYSPEQRAAERDEMRRGGRVAVEVNSREERNRLNAIDRQVEQAKARATGRKTFDMGASLDSQGRLVR